MTNRLTERQRNCAALLNDSLFVPQTEGQFDPPPPKWSALRYGFEPEEDRDGEQEAPA